MENIATKQWCLLNLQTKSKTYIKKQNKQRTLKPFKTLDISDILQKPNK